MKMGGREIEKEGDGCEGGVMIGQVEEILVVEDLGEKKLEGLEGGEV